MQPAYKYKMLYDDVKQTTRCLNVLLQFVAFIFAGRITNEQVVQNADQTHEVCLLLLARHTQTHYHSAFTATLLTVGR